MPRLVPTMSALNAVFLTAAATLSPTAYAADADNAAELRELKEMVRDLTQEVRQLRTESKAQPTPTVEPPQQTVSNGPVGDWFPDFEVPDDVLVVTPNRREVSQLRSAGTIIKLDEADLNDLGKPGRVRDVLSNQPGIFWRQNGSFAGSTSVSLRGTNAFDTRFLVDGLPLIDPSSLQGQTRLAVLNAAGVDGYEVALGAQSVVYGSQAVGGVVNLQTMRPTDEFKLTTRLEGGSDNTYSGEVRVSGPIIDGLAYAVSLRGTTSEGQSTRYARPNTDPNNVFPSYSTPAPPTSTFYSSLFNSSNGYAAQVASQWRYNADSDNPFPWDVRTAAIPAGDPDGHEEDGAKMLGFRGRVEWTPDDYTLLYVAVDNNISRVEYDGFNAPDDYLSETARQELRVSAGGEFQFTPKLSVKTDVLYSGSDRTEEDFNNLTSNKHFLGDYFYGSAQATYEFNQTVAVTAGIDGTWQEIGLRTGDGRHDVIAIADRLVNGRQDFTDSSLWFPPQPEFQILGQSPNEQQTAFLNWRASQPIDESTFTFGGWAELAFTGDDYTLTLAGRHDANDLAGDASTFRISAAYFALDDRVKFHGVAATGFRAPSLFELYSLFGNTDLEPQQSISYEAGVTVRPWDWLTADITWYRTDYRQQIIFYSPFNLSVQQVNYAANGYRNAEGDSWVSGYELSATIAPPDSPWQVRLWYNPQRSESGLANGETRPFRRIPSKQLGAQGTWQFPFDAWITVGVRHVGEQYTGDTRYTDFNGNALRLPAYSDGYTVAYAAAGWRFMDGWEIYGRAENIGDEDYEEIQGFTTTRPSVTLGIEGTF